MKMERVLPLYQVCIRMLHNTRTPHGPLRTSHKGQLSGRPLADADIVRQTRAVTTAHGHANGYCRKKQSQQHSPQVSPQ